MVSENYLGWFGWTKEEKIASILKPLLKGSGYEKYGRPEAVKNMIPYYTKWVSVARKIPVYTAPFQGDSVSKIAVKSINSESGIPVFVVDAFLYAMYESVSEGKVNVKTFDPTTKKPMPIDPKKLIYGTILLGGILGIGWVSANLTKLIKG